MGLPDGYAVDMELHCFLGHGATWVGRQHDTVRQRSAGPRQSPRRRSTCRVAAPRTPSRRSTLVVPGEPWVVVGGQSFGGRVASLAAAEPGAPYAALVLFSYPLHPPGSPEKAEARTSHWPQIRCPVLLLSGESDPFAKIDLLRAAVPAPGRPGRARHLSEARAWPHAGARRRARSGRHVPRDHGAEGFVRPLALTVLRPYRGPPGEAGAHRRPPGPDPSRCRSAQSAPPDRGIAPVPAEPTFGALTASFW